MSAVFISRPGQMVAMPSDNPRGFTFDLGFTTDTGVVVSLNSRQGVASQFQPSLDRVVYAVPFGDTMGQIQARLLVNPRCEGQQGGIDAIQLYYQNNRFMPNNSQPKSLVIGRTAYKGFILDFTLDASSEQGHIAYGTLSFATWQAQGQNG